MFEIMHHYARQMQKMVPFWNMEEVENIVRRTLIKFLQMQKFK